MLYTYHTSVIHLYGFIMFTKCLSVKILEHVYESEENKWKYCREVVDKLPTETDEQGYQGQQIFLGTSPQHAKFIARWCNPKRKQDCALTKSIPLNMQIDYCNFHRNFFPFTQQLYKNAFLPCKTAHHSLYEDA